MYKTRMLHSIYKYLRINEYLFLAYIVAMVHDSSINKQNIYKIKTKVNCCSLSESNYRIITFMVHPIWLILFPRVSSSLIFGYSTLMTASEYGGETISAWYFSLRHIHSEKITCSHSQRYTHTMLFPSIFLNQLYLFIEWSSSE